MPSDAGFGAEGAPYITRDKIRYADTDQQGHVNSAVFSTFLETGRAELLYSPESMKFCIGCNFVIASLNIDYKAPLYWPGDVMIETWLNKVGVSSLGLSQRLIQGGKIAAEAKTIIVQVGIETKASVPFTQEMRAFLDSFLVVD